MPWKARSKAMLREEFVKEVLSKKGTKSELCRKYGISRPTGDKWIERYLKGESLDDKSKAPFKTANKISADMEQQIVAYRTNYPAIGAVKIRRMMLDEGCRDLPSASTFNNVFKRNGLIDKQESMLLSIRSIFCILSQSMNPVPFFLCPLVYNNDKPKELVKRIVR